MNRTEKIVIAEFATILFIYFLGVMPFIYNPVNFVVAPLAMLVGLFTNLWFFGIKHVSLRRCIPFLLFTLFSSISIFINGTPFSHLFWNLLISVLYIVSLLNAVWDKATFTIAKITAVSLLAIITISVLLAVLYHITDLGNHPSIYVSSSINNVFIGNSSRLNGMTENANMLGMVSALAATILINSLRKQFRTSRKWTVLKIVSFSLALTTLFFTQSRAAILSAFAGIFFSVFCSIRSTKIRKSIFCIFISLMIIALIYLPEILRFLTNITGRDWVTGSYRTDIWEFSISLIKKNPIWGYSDGFSNLIYEKFHVSSAHNFILELLGQFGIPAALCIVTCLLYNSYICIRDFLTSNIDVKQACMYSVFIMFIVRGLFESSIESSIVVFVMQIPTVTIFVLGDTNSDDKETSEASRMNRLSPLS